MRWFGGESIWFAMSRPRFNFIVETLKTVCTASLLCAYHKRNSVEKKPTSLVDISGSGMLETEFLYLYKADT